MTKLFRHGLALENQVKQIVLSIPGVKELSPQKQTLLQTLSCLYKDKQLGYLKSEGYQHWGQVPTSRVLDQCFGIDLLISFRGYWIALDITGKDSRVKYKSDRFRDRNQRRMFRALDLDTAAVLFAKDVPSVERAQEILEQLIKHHRFGGVVIA